MGWKVGKFKCRICGYSHISVYPVDIFDETRTECPDCEHMTSELIANLLVDGSWSTGNR